jgi:hypothetical protein
LNRKSAKHLIVGIVIKFHIFYLEHLFVVADGWGNKEFRIQKGLVMIRAWISQIVISEYVLKDVRTDEDDHAIEYDQCFDIDNHLNVVQVRILDEMQYNALNFIQKIIVTDSDTVYIY